MAEDIVSLSRANHERHSLSLSECAAASFSVTKVRKFFPLSIFLIDKGLAKNAGMLFVFWARLPELF
jgi:hypothetical protein